MSTVSARHGVRPPTARHLYFGSLEEIDRDGLIHVHGRGRLLLVLVVVGSDSHHKVGRCASSRHKRDGCVPCARGERQHKGAGAFAAMSVTTGAEE
eukprot:1912674-Prymnesium_polylepis.1